MPYTDLDRPAQFLRGVGPQRAKLLAKLGVHTARDLLFHIPRRYEDASTVTPVGSLQPGMDATVIGRVVSQGVLPTRRALRIFQAVVRDRAGGYLECAWPGQPFLDRVIQKGDLLLLRGPVRFFHGIQMQPREYIILARAGEAAPEEEGLVFPVYAATEGLTHRQIRAIVGDNLEDLLEAVGPEDLMSDQPLDRLGLPDLRTALLALHAPERLDAPEAGRRRLAYEELFFLQLLHARAHHEVATARPGIVMDRRDTLVRPFYRGLPFTLTGAQKRVLSEIGSDMASARRMHRLLQGDVGSGKTVVALFAMLRAVENGYQAALMAPTEILAEQHLRTIRGLLGPLDVRTTLLTGRLGAAERRRALAEVASSEPGLVIGTHALIQDRVRFGRLGLAVVDEQHRFGVRQRLALVDAVLAGAEAGMPAPDTLLMSATPIPRSLALTLYGDLDLSILDERPPGRTPVRTALRPARARDAVFDFVRSRLDAGGQAYVVYPLVEESEKTELLAATAEVDRLRAEVFPDHRVGLIHGQMPGAEKDRVMLEFRAGNIDVLAATTVIEVGIDVPNATVMVIEHAERFGLSQLHQLRGRVGRGEAESFCILLAESPAALERLRIFASTDDGFRIAEADLRLRGQGDLFGDRQSGLPAFRFADLEKDVELLVVARERAQALIREDAELLHHPAIRESLTGRYGEKVTFFSTG